jgi:excinuclease UvrABC nuclease subunit
VKTLLPPKPIAWTSVPTVHGKNHNIPATSGIYAYGEVERIGGLPVRTRWVYIGKSRNLRTRIGNGHDPRRECNADLRVWLKRAKKDVELWFASVPEDELDAVERDFIRNVQPEFNIKLK